MYNYKTVLTKETFFYIIRKEIWFFRFRLYFFTNYNENKMFLLDLLDIRIDGILVLYGGL